MKRIFLVLVLCHVFQSGFASESSKPFVGYGSSNAIITDKILEGFLSGFELGYSSLDKSDSFRVEQSRDQSALGSVRSAQKLLNSGAIGLFGFPGSSDALLVGKIAQKEQIISVFPGCNHTGLGQLGNTVFSTGHTSDSEIRSQLRFTFEKLKKRRVLAIINPMAAPSAVEEEILNSQKVRDEFPNIVIQTTRLQPDLKLEPEILRSIAERKFDVLFLTPYPEASVNFVEQLINSGTDSTIVAGSAWGTVDSDVMRRYVAKKKAAFYMMTTWRSHGTEGRRFRASFLKRYAKEPTAESAYGFDLGVIAATVLGRTKSPYSRQAFFKAFHANLCFKGLSSGTLCFPKDGGHVKRPISFLEYTKSGFLPVFEVKP